MAAAGFYAVLQRMLMRGLGLFSTLILVRLLAPDDFGIVAMASAVFVVLDMLSATGFGLALIRMRDPQQIHYDTVFTLTLARGVIIFIALLALAQVQASLMEEPRIAPVMGVVALSVLMQSCESPRLVDMQRDLRFDRLLRYYLLGKVLAMVISLPLAFWLQNYWALVLCGPLMRLVTIPCSYRLAPYRPRLSLRAWRELFGFSKWLMLGNLCSVVDGQLMNFIIGRFHGMAAIGLYQVGLQIAVLPISEIAAPLRQPIYAGFSRIYHDIDELRRLFMAGFELQWLTLLPLTVGLALTSHEVTLLFLGEKWLALTTLMPLVTLFGLFDAFGVYTHNVFVVLNKQAALVTTYFVLILVRLAAAIYGATSYGIEGAAWAWLITSILNATLWQVMVGPLLQLPLRTVLRALLRGSLAAVAMSGLVLLLPADIGVRFVPSVWLVAVTFAIKVTLGAVAYIGTIVILWLAAGAPPQSAEAYLIRASADVWSRIVAAISLRRRQV